MSIFGDRGSGFPSYLASSVPSLLDYVTFWLKQSKFVKLRAIRNKNKLTRFELSPIMSSASDYALSMASGAVVAGDHGNNMDDDSKRDVSQAASFVSADDDTALDFSVSPPTKSARPTSRAVSVKRGGDSPHPSSAGGSRLPVRRKIVGGARSASAGSPARLALRAPPRPRLGVPEHRVVDTAKLQQDEQLAALVQQQSVDHEQFRSIGTAMAQLADVVAKQQSAIEDLTEQLKSTTNGGLLGCT